MKKPAAILLVIAILSYICFPVLGVFAENAEADSSEKAEIAAASSGVTSGDLQGHDLVSDFEELEAWIQDNGDSGKTVTFLNTITIPHDESLFIFDTTLNTANHGLIILGNVRLYDAKITGDGITDEGAENPVVTVKSGGRLDVGSGLPEITATGLDGRGGCAVKIESGGTFNTLMNGSGGIRSEGTDAVGVYSEGGLKLSGISVVSGGTGVKAGGDVELFLCDIDAPNPIETNGTVLLDTCIVSDTVENAAVIDRKIIGIAEEHRESLYNMLTLGGEIPHYWFLEELRVVLENDREYTVSVSWDVSAVDVNTAGEYEVTGTILAPYDRFRLDRDFPIVAKVEVVDASFPVFYEIFAGRGRYTFSFLYDADDTGGLTLWRSDDEGESWYDYTQDSGLYFDETLMLTFSEVFEAPVLLMFKVEGLGESEILRVIWDDENGYYTERGGDRNGLDRGGEDELPQILKPEPEHNLNPAPIPETEPESKPEPKPERELYAGSTRASSRTRTAASTAADTDPVLPAHDDTAPPPDDIEMSAEAAQSGESAVAEEASEDVRGQSETVHALPTEFENDMTTAVSGKRLSMMINAGNKVAFIKEDVRLSFDSSELEALNIGDDQLFMVTVEQLEQLQYKMIVSLDGAELENLPCSVTLGGKQHDIFVSGTYDFAQTTGERETAIRQTDISDTAVGLSPLDLAGGEPEKQDQGAADKPFAPEKLVIAVLGTAGIAGASAFGLKIRVKRHGR